MPLCVCGSRFWFDSRTVTSYSISRARIWTCTYWYIPLPTQSIYTMWYGLCPLDGKRHHLLTQLDYITAYDHSKMKVHTANFKCADAKDDICKRCPTGSATKVPAGTLSCTPERVPPWHESVSKWSLRVWTHVPAVGGGLYGLMHPNHSVWAPHVK